MKYNIIPLAVNVSRAFEIAACGGHTIKVIANADALEDDRVDPNDIEIVVDGFRLLVEYKQIEFNNVCKPDIVVTLGKPDKEEMMACFNSKGRYETIDDIQKRITEFKGRDKKEFDEALQGGGSSILKSAIEKLNLSFTDVTVLLSVAKTIAQMDGNNGFGVQHIAEAIHYVGKY